MLLTQKLTVHDIAQDVKKIEKIIHRAYFPVVELPMATEGDFKIQPHLYDANTIKEATEDLEQSSKGGSIAFRSKGLFFKKASSIASLIEK